MEKSIAIAIVSGGVVIVALAMILAVVPNISKINVGPGNLDVETAPAGYIKTAAGEQQVIKTPVVSSFSAIPGRISQGGTSKIEWSVTGDSIASVQIKPEIGNVPLSGNREVSPRSTTTYVITATNDRGKSYSADALLVVATTVNFNATSPAPRTIQQQTIQQIAPANGALLHNYPRVTQFKWTPVSGATGYVLEVQWCNGCKDEYPLVKTTGPAYTMPSFVGANVGKWRIWAVDASGNEGPKSDWWTFEYTI